MNNSQKMPVIAKSLFVLKLLWAAIGFLFLWALITALVELVVVEFVPLGPRFATMTTIFAPVVALPFAIAPNLIKPRNPKPISDPHKRHPSKAALLLISATVLMMGAAMSPAAIERLSRPGDAETALKSFVPIYGTGVDPAKVERTLAEFERARRKLADQWEVPDSRPRISLYLFRDSREYKEYMAPIGLDWSGGYANCLEDRVTIGVPLEEASNVFEETPASGTPVHEMVHATWCQSLGQDFFRAIPRWFHEGMAQRYENEGMRGFLDRALNRWMVWIDRGNLLSAMEFCGYASGGSRAEIRLLYSSSWELIRSLEAGHGIQTLNAVVVDVGAGKSFDNSLLDRFGGTCGDLYTKWSQSL